MRARDNSLYRFFLKATPPKNRKASPNLCHCMSFFCGGATNRSMASGFIHKSTGFFARLPKRRPLTSLLGVKISSDHHSPRSHQVIKWCDCVFPSALVIQSKCTDGVRSVRWWRMVFGKCNFTCVHCLPAISREQQRFAKIEQHANGALYSRRKTCGCGLQHTMYVYAKNYTLKIYSKHKHGHRSGPGPGSLLVSAPVEWFGLG